MSEIIVRSDGLTLYVSVLALTIAGERAAKITKPGSFLSGLIDELWDMTPTSIRKHARLDVYT